MMDYRRLGRSGLKVSEVSLGAWFTFGSQVDEDTSIRLIRAAFEAGVNFFDNADMYAEGQAESVMGRAIRGLPREALVLSSKVFFPTFPGTNGRGLSRKHIFESVHASLRRLATEYLDLYFCHRYDPETPLDEVVQAMGDLVRQGKVLYWGTSRWNAGQIAAAIAAAQRSGTAQPVVEQCRYNMLDRRALESDLVTPVREFGLGLVTFSPLAYGVLSGKYSDGIPSGSRASYPEMAWIRERINAETAGKVRALGEIASGLGLTTAQLAIAWILRRPEVSSVITGATRLEQLTENLQARDALPRLDAELLERIEQLLGNRPEEV